MTLQPFEVFGGLLETLADALRMFRALLESGKSEDMALVKAGLSAYEDLLRDSAIKMGGSNERNEHVPQP